MMNVSDSFVTSKNSFDFEECTVSAMEIDSWETNQSSNSSNGASIKDNTIISIFTQSIEMFGNSMAPWPTGKSVPEQVAGLFITSEPQSPDQDRPPQYGPESNKPIVQSKLRRSNSSKSRRFSISRVNEEDHIDSKQLYQELEPIPVVSSERCFQAIPAKDAAIFDPKVDQQQRSKYSRLQSWLSSLYSRSNSTGQGGKSKDEESAFSTQRIKGILKKEPKTASGSVQKSVTIPENEVKKMSQDLPASPPSSNATPEKPPKKHIKIRFDNEVSVCETFHKEDYCRQSLDYVARQLTPALALSIKKELNSVKQEMEVHEESRHLTQFYLIK